VPGRSAFGPGTSPRRPSALTSPVARAFCRFLVTNGLPQRARDLTRDHVETSRGPAVPLPRMRMQPVALSEVAAHLAAVALGPALGLALDLAGPGEHQSADVARRLLRAQNRRRLVPDLRLPGSAAKVAAAAALLPAARDLEVGRPATHG
jgi:uncharacterized protein YbjT (DUF2867 family)